MKRILGVIFIVWAIIFARLETNHFGNNWLPESNEEIICDITALLLSIAGHILFWQKRK